MKQTFIKILFITSLLYPLFSYSEDINNRGLLSVNKDPRLVQGKYFLLAIGIDNYINLPKLATAVGDTKEVTRVLTEEYGFEKGMVTELYNANATERNIVKALRNIAKAIKPEDSLLIYYAGHGTLDDLTKQGAWLPVDASQDDPTSWIENTTIKKYLSSDAINAKHILLISDSCFAGDFFREGYETPKEITDAFVRTAFLKTSREAITSGGVEPVQDAGFSNHSVFSHFLLKALKENKEDYLLPQSIHERIRGGVSQNASQQAQYGTLHNTGGEVGGSFVFFKKSGGGAENLDKILEDKKIQMTLMQEREKELAKAKEAQDKEVKEREEKIALLDKDIAEMKARLGEKGTTGNNTNLDNIVAMVKEKKKQNKELEEMRERAEKERVAREEEIKRLKREEAKKKITLLEEDILKYKEVAYSEFGKDFTTQAWKSLLAKWGVKKKSIKDGDLETFIDMLAGKYTFMREDSKSLKMRLFYNMVFVKGGCFDMWKWSTFEYKAGEEKPVYEVCVDDFYIGKYEVTQREWKKVMGSNPSHFKDCDNCPVEQVGWDDIQDYINKLNQNTGDKYRLPTEAEWEYAAQSGSKKEKYAGDNDLGSVAWYKDNSGGKTHPVGQKKENGLGIYDMIGNVQEWVSDWHYYVDHRNPKVPFPSGDGTITQDLLDKIQLRELEIKIDAPEKNSADEIVGGLGETTDYPDIASKVKTYQSQGLDSKKILELIKSLPRSPSERFKVIRGGSWDWDNYKYDAMNHDMRASTRASGLAEEDWFYATGFRLALSNKNHKY